MVKQIWLGPLLGSNRDRLIERCATLVSTGKSNHFLYLTASHPLLEIVTQGILDGQTNRGVWGELPVYLFRGFVRRLLSSAMDHNGQLLAARVPIDQTELPLKHSLVSQILTRLLDAGKLKAIAPLASRDGCVNTIAKLIGEIERAAKLPGELRQIIAERTADLDLPNTRIKNVPPAVARQIDYDSEVALIYESYCELLDRHQLTEADADQLRALSLLKGELNGVPVEIPWLPEIELLVLDGFFDFTPVQGEILRRLIPQIPEVIVNLNHDERNPEIFLPFQETIGHLEGIATFEKLESSADPRDGALAQLGERLFNPSITPPSTAATETETVAEAPPSPFSYLECGDRETEIRAIAKEIKRLVLCEGYHLGEIALVVRQRTAYAETIARVMREESLPCNLEIQIEANDIPANRAALKLFAILEALARNAANPPLTAELADLIKSEYFRLGDADLATLSTRFDKRYSDLLRDNGSALDAKQTQRLKDRYGVGRWDADLLENTFAYVGSELRVSDWLERAGKLIKELPQAAATRELLNIEIAEQARDPDEADQIENAETAKFDARDVERKRRPSRDIHPATIAWTALVLEEFASHIGAVPQTGAPRVLRRELMKLLDQFGFREQIVKPIRDTGAQPDLPRALVNFNSLETLRRAFVAAVRSIELTEPPNAGDSTTEIQTSLATLLEEVRRSLSAQTQTFGSADRRGLRVLEATDVRGLRFRALFIAGLIEGGFPLRASRDWIYPHEERERLKRYGLTLEDISPATLLKEEHYFYQVACRATDRLYLTRPLALEDDSETVASYYIDELRRAIAPAELPVSQVRRDYEGANLELVSRGPDLNVALIRQQERHRHRGNRQPLLPEPRIKRLLTLARNDGFLSELALRRIEIERERAGIAFGPYDGEITDPHLLALLRQRFGPDFMHSASSLGVYGNCAYRFFGQKVLRLEPRGEAALDLQAIDAGKLLHDILRRFFERHRRQPLYQLDRAALQKEMRDLADEVFDEHERVVPPLNRQIWKIDREIRKILLDQVLLYELDVQEKAKADCVLPAYFEVAFGGLRSTPRDPHSQEAALELSRSTFVGPESIRISGQIDRVDEADDKTIIAYDYKLSTGSSKEDMKAGRSLQLPIYLEALERLLLPQHTLAGGGYYIIRGGSERRNRGLQRAAALDYFNIHPKASAVLGDDEWRQVRAAAIAKIWEFLDQMREGNFAVDPSEKKKTCRFCDFAAVCRYERFRIERKKRVMSNEDE